METMLIKDRLATATAQQTTKNKQKFNASTNLKIQLLKRIPLPSPHFKNSNLEPSHSFHPSN